MIDSVFNFSLAFYVVQLSEVFIVHCYIEFVYPDVIESSKRNDSTSVLNVLSSEI